MKTLVIALLLSFSTPAFADYFGCELRNGFEKTDVEAEYRGREVSIYQRPLICDGQILSDGQIVVEIRSTETNEYQTATGKGSTVTAVLTDTAICSCGLR